MSRKLGVALLIIAGVISCATAVAHLSCIYFGPECYASQMAPPEVVESAKAGTLLAPIGTLIVSIIFIGIGAYAFSAAGLISTLPKLKVIIYLIGFACIIRGVLPTQLWLRYPEKVSDPVLYVGFVWFLVGVFFLLGFRWVTKASEPQE